MSAIFPTAIAQTLDLLTAVNNTKVTLNVAAGIGDTTLTVDDASPLPNSGYLTFDDNETNPETVSYTGKSGNNLTGVTRAADGTAAGVHSTGVHLEQRWNAAYHNIPSTEIIAIEQNLSDRIGLDSGTHVLKIVAGLVGAPALQFAGDPNTGVYSVGADLLGIATGGVLAVEVNASQQLLLPKTSNQIIIGTTNTVTISSSAPASSRTYTIPDAGANASFVMTQGAQTLGGVTTVPAGLVNTPSIIFTGGGTGTGIWSSGANNIDFATGGIAALKIDGNGSLRHVDGVVNAPSITFSNDPDCGLFRVGTNEIALSTNGINQIDISTTAVTLGLPLAMGAHKITTLSNGTASTDAVAFGQIFTGFQAPVQSISQSSFTTSSNTFQSTGLAGTITPTSSSHRIKISVSGVVRSTTGVANVISVFRGATNLATGAAAAFQEFNPSPATNNYSACSFIFIDSPGTTSATTYTVKVRNDDNATTIGWGNTFDTVIILEEIV